MASTSKLQLYNAALTICGERNIASLTEDREPRRLLDEAWDNGAINACLEMGQWSFAMRAVRIDYDAAVTPDFGYNRAFSKPTDWRLTSAVCTDEYYKDPLTDYIDEADYWYADIDEIYVRYVSSDAAYGADYSLWSESFRLFVEAFLATQIILKLTADEKKQDRVEKVMEKRLKKAKSVSASTGPTKFPPPGNFVTNRTRGGGRRYDRGNKGSLIG